MIINYIDPGTGSMLISASVALISVAFFLIKGFLFRTFNIAGDKGEIIDPNKKYGLVFYSEGKQYWNVFKPLIDESVERGIPVTYLTSDKEDPGMETDINLLDVIYIGTGREAYFSLNRLNAEVVVMTTPGLDVLEIKRSKNVNHYCHITHATSSCASYKSYSTDYYDSVLIGGEGEVNVLRELEVKRNLPRKDIQIIGHTYLDVLREKLTKTNYEYTLFKDKRKTILISPTWGDHGLLTKYGDKLLSDLIKENKFNIIVRPHPQSFTSDKLLIDALMSKYPNDDNLVWDKERDNLKSMAHADLMISDFSGIIFDFYTLFNKPILTIHGQYEKRGREAADLSDDPWDIKILDDIGVTINDSNINKITEIIQDNIDDNKNISRDNLEILNLMDKYPNESGLRGMNFLEKVLGDVERYKIKEDEDIVDKKVNVKGQLLSEYLFQMILGSVMLLCISLFGIKILPKDGLNTNYLRNLLPFIVIVIPVLMISLSINMRISGSKNIGVMKSNKNPLIFFVAILPMVPIIQYVLLNQDILDFINSLKVLMYFSVITIIFIVAIPVLFSPLIDINLSISVMTSITFIIFNMASFGRVTRVRYIVIIMLLIISAIYILLNNNKNKILITIVMLFMLSNTVGSLININKDDEIVDNGVTNGSWTEVLSNMEAVAVPDIHILIYDSYSNEETMDSLGYDNTNQLDYLLDNGFTIYDGAYSVGADSLLSISTMFDVSVPSMDLLNLRNIVAGDSKSIKALKELGYITQFASDSDYMIKESIPKYDIVYPSKEDSISPSEIIINAIKEGEFRFDAEFSTATHEGFIEFKNKMLSTHNSKPVFTYSHSEFPGHSQNSGVILPEDIKNYYSGIDKANEEMIKDIESIRSLNKDAIIVIAGDHGPYQTKNGIGLDGYAAEEISLLDIQDRFGAFLAISWPEDLDGNKSNIVTIQDVMPAIMGEIYNEESIFDMLKMSNDTLTPKVTGGIEVHNGIVKGGIFDGESLFKNTGKRVKDIIDK